MHNISPMTHRLAAGLLGAALLATTAIAPAQTSPGSKPATPAATASSLPLVDAEVRKVDLGAGKITLKHGEIPNLDMPPMSMVFRASRPGQLDAFEAGDKVRFSAEEIQGVLTVVHIEKAP